MIYNNKQIKNFGFGLMRLPMIGEEIDMTQVKDMVDLFIENGFTYFDTAFGYHKGKSEIAFKEAVVDRYPRDSYVFATKLPAWLGPKTSEEAKAMFDKSLEKTGAGFFDFYLLHNMGGKRTKVFEDFGIWEFLLEKKSLGLIKKLGFSYHGGAADLEELLKEKSEYVDFVQLQINYADWLDETVQSKKCYEVARKYGKEVIIMEPIRGGALVNPPKAIAELLKSADPEQSFPSWALRFAGSLDGVMAVLSGMSTMEQMTENLKTFKDFKPLTDSEQETLSKAQDILANAHSIPCTSCRYCVQECPAKIDIPTIFAAMNSQLIFEDTNKAKIGYNGALITGNGAETCLACGQCESVCPQSIKIIDELKNACDMFDIKD